MTTSRIQRILEPRATGDSLAAMFLWQLDDLSRRLTEDTRGAAPQELSWQPAPGLNSIGMLLAHIALMEVGWIGRGVLDRGWDEGSILPLRWEEDAIPLAADGRPPATLEGKDLGYFDELLERARAHTRQVVEGLSDGDLARRFECEAFWQPGTRFEATVGWVLYHLLEHQAGHHGQINLLRHLYRARQGA